MPLHIIKLSVGSEDIDDMYRWLKDSKAGRDMFSHTTRMFPRRKEEILPGGSLYWVIRGVVLCRTPIADLVPVIGKDGIERCRIDFKHQYDTPQDAAGHVKAAIVGHSRSFIIEAGNIVFGHSQKIYFWEFDGPRSRMVNVKVVAG